MMIISLIFLSFICINIIFSFSFIKDKNTDEYMKEIEKDLCEELKIIK